MSNYARIINNVAVDVSTDPKNSFHPILAADFVEVPAEVSPSWILTGSTWSAPVSVATETPKEVGNLKPSPMEFLLLLTLAEQAAIRAAAPNDSQVGILVSMVDDTRLTFVDLTHPTVIEAIQYLAGKPTLLTADRAARVLAGLPPKATA
ncbi:hypothetical protein OMP44_09085 [Pseudomonas sp. CBMAI 2609]|uniref:Uncharacterized protein n=1 Tax=Pseudomonas flavocrustae TaxID=2991719 RepID=A0ABT6IGA5_9PSED|nr:hypothetical protein [Pseudomonas sp. CBMAI 2609]MDH4763049.1 hypothetical protein [Pseudomonas sp. CBMAI 2609]